MPMSPEHTTLEAHLKKTTSMAASWAAFVAVFVSLSAIYGFYYVTNDTLDAHGRDIEIVKQDVSEINTKISESAVFQGVSKTETDALKRDNQRIESKVDKMNDKLDKILMQTR